MIGNCAFLLNCAIFNEEQIIHGYLINGAMVQVWSESYRCFVLQNNAFVARGILITLLHCGTPEFRLRAIYIVSSVGTSLILE